MHRSIPVAALIVFVVLTVPGAAFPVQTRLEPSPRLAGTLPQVEETILQALQAARLTDPVLRVAADTNGHLTVAAVVFAHRLRSADDRPDLRAFAWRLVQTSLASVPSLDELHLVGIRLDDGMSQGNEEDVIFTAAISRAELSRISAGSSAGDAFALLPRVWHSVPPAGERPSDGAKPPAAPGSHVARSSGRRLADIYHGDRSRRALAITFDDGPFPIYTTLLLDTLERLGVKATFFLVGEQVQRYPYFTRAIAQAGHEIGNHGFYHVNLTLLPDAQIAEQLARAQEVISDVTGRVPRYFRPPGGDYSRAILQVAHNLGLTTVFWTANSGDYASVRPRSLKGKILARTSNGGIVLLHQGVANTIRILPQTVETLRQRGYALTTVSGLLSSRRSLFRNVHNRGVLIGIR